MTAGRTAAVVPVEKEVARPWSLMYTAVSSSAVALLVIAITCIWLWIYAAQFNFLLCDTDCGETGIAVTQAMAFQDEGFRYGLLQNHGTSDHPQLYTHNVHIGGMLFSFLE